MGIRPNLKPVNADTTVKDFHKGLEANMHTLGSSRRRE